MKQILISSTLVWNASLADLFRRVYENGLGGIEMWAQHFYSNHYSITEFQRLRQQYPLQVVVHSCSWDLNLSSMNEAVRKTSVREVVRSLALAKQLGATEVTVHPGHMTMPCWRDESMRIMHASLQEIADASYRLAMPVSLEIMEHTKKEIVTDMAAMEEVTGDLFDFFSYTLDIAHCDSVDEALYTLNHLRHISKLHISNRKGPQYHTLLDDGDYDFTRLLPDLCRYDVPMVVEGYDPQGGWGAFYEDLSFLNAQKLFIQSQIS